MSPELRTMIGALAVASMFSSCGSAAQDVPPGRIIGHIDGIAITPAGWHVTGWACQQRRPEAIALHIFATADAGLPDTLVYAGTASIAEEAAVDTACQDTIGRKHRFDIPLPGSLLVKVHGMRLSVRGLCAFGTVDNAALAGSGTLRFPDSPPFRTAPPNGLGAYPRVVGRYVSLASHPRVFDTSAQLQDIAARANKAGSFSHGRFAALAARVGQDMASHTDWQSTYTGCDMEIYLRGFSYEQRPAYGNNRTDDELRAAMQGKPDLGPPHGAAIVAARAALYAALVQAGAQPPQGAVKADNAAAFSKSILLAWADHGFRNKMGGFRLTDADYCDLNPNGKPHVTQFGTFVGALTLSRGIIYSVDTQDLLQGIGAVTHDEQARLDAFHRQMFELIRAVHNQEYSLNMKWKYSDEVYNNQFVSHLTALLAISRLFNDRLDFDATLNGGGGTEPTKLPWTELFDNVIYGVNDAPHLNITPNTSVDPLMSRPAFSTISAAPGEINDRFRNDNPLQGFGYSMGSLQSLYMAAEIMKSAGLDAYGYHGAHGQSIEMATRFAACFAQEAGFAKVVTAKNSHSCPDNLQYWGKVVNGAENNMLIGTYRFADDNSLSSLEVSAKDAYARSSNSLEPILFGKWHD